MNRVWLLPGAVAVGQLANSVILPAVPLLARDFGEPANRAGLVVTVYFGGFALVGLVAGPLADRFGRRPLLVSGLAMLACGSVACALAASFWALLVFRLLQAAGAAGTPVLSRAIIRDTSHERNLASALGLLAASMSISPVFGPIVGGLLADSVGWRWLFGLVAILATFAALAVHGGVRETLVPRAPGKPGGTWRDMQMLLAQPRFCNAVVYGAACYFAFGALYTAAPFVLIARFGLTHFQFGAVFALVSLCLAVGGLAGPRLIGFAAQLKLLDGAAGMVIAAGLLLLAVAVFRDDSAAAVVLCFALFGLAFGVALSVGAGLTLGDADDAAGTASSLSGSLQIAMAAVGSAAVNLLPSGSLIPLSLILLCAGAVALLAVRRIRQADAA